MRFSPQQAEQMLVRSAGQARFPLREWQSGQTGIRDGYSTKDGTRNPVPEASMGASDGSAAWRKRRPSWRSPAAGTSVSREGAEPWAHPRRLAAHRLTDRRKARDIVPVPAYIVERLSARDYEALVDLWRDADLSYRPLGRDSRQAILAQMAMPHCRFLGVRGEGALLLGSVIANHEGRKGWI